MVNLEVKNTNVKVKFGIIKASKMTDAMLQYKVLLEAHHSSSTTVVECSNGIPVFYSGVNTKRYSDGTRVLCICEGDSIDEVFILGEIDDRNKKDTYSDKVFEGQNYLSSISDYSGLIGLGNSGRITMWNGSSSLIMTTKNLSLDVDGSNVFEATKNGIKLKASDNQLVLSDNSFLSSINGIQLLSTGGPIEIGGENIFLNSGNLLSLSASNTVEIKAPVFNVSSGVFKFKSVAGKAFSPLSPSIDMSVLSGNIQIATADGSIEMSILSPTSPLPPPLGTPGLANKMMFSIGPPLLESCFMEMKAFPLSKITLGIGPALLPTTSLELSTTGATLSSIPMKVDISPTGVIIGIDDPTGLLAEPAVKGDMLNTFLTKLITEIMAITVPTALGPSGVPLNIAKLTAMITELQAPVVPHLSLNVKVT